MFLFYSYFKSELSTIRELIFTRATFREKIFFENIFFLFSRELIFPKKPTSHNLRQLNLVNFARKLFPVTFCMRLKKGV